MNCFLFHKWTKWTELPPVQATIHYPILGRSFDATIREQFRKCERCGKVQRERIT